ncbi:MAG: hypothetical protein WDW36_006514 [Sanguina aurantia]
MASHAFLACFTVLAAMCATVREAGFVFNGDDGNAYNLHSDGMEGLLLGNPFTALGEADTPITSFYAQHDGDSVTMPELSSVDCFGDYTVGTVGHDKPSPGDGWTAGTYLQRAFPKASVDDAMTVDMCAFVAMAGGFSLFGVENGRECWYGNDDAENMGANAQRFGAAPDMCTVPCMGNSMEMCGSPSGAISIWAIPPMEAQI